MRVRARVRRDHPAVIKRRFTSVLVVSGLAPLFVWVWRESTGLAVSVANAGRSCPAGGRTLVSPDPTGSSLSTRVCVCVSDHALLSGAHGTPMRRPHSRHRAAASAHHGNALISTHNVS